MPSEPYRSAHPPQPLPAAFSRPGRLRWACECRARGGDRTIAAGSEKDDSLVVLSLVRIVFLKLPAKSASLGTNDRILTRIKVGLTPIDFGRDRILFEILSV